MQLTRQLKDVPFSHPLPKNTSIFEFSNAILVLGGGGLRCWDEFLIHRAFILLTNESRRTDNYELASLAALASLLAASAQLCLAFMLNVLCVCRTQLP